MRGESFIEEKVAYYMAEKKRIIQKNVIRYRFLIQLKAERL